MLESPRWLFLREVYPGLDRIIVFTQKLVFKLKRLFSTSNNYAKGISPSKLPRNLMYGLFIIFLGYFAAFSILWRLDNPSARITPILTGSMEPTIKTGSLIFTSASNNYYVGDVITYRETHPKTGVETDRTLTHRIIATKQLDNETVYIAQGDASRVPDINDIRKEYIYGKMIYSVPYAGYIYSFVRTVPGFLLFIAIPAYLLIKNEINHLRYNRIMKSIKSDSDPRLDKVIVNR